MPIEEIHYNAKFCKICDKEFYNNYALSRHLKKHQLTSKQYYDIYLSEEKNKCKMCNSNTIFRSIIDGYSTYCSVKCRSNDKEYHKLIHDKSRITYRDNPNIMKNSLLKRKETYRNNPNIEQTRIKNMKGVYEKNPEIIQNRINAYKETLSNDLSINIKRGKSISNTLKENPEIIENRKKKRSLTLKENPEILRKMSKSIKLFNKNNPIALINRTNNQSITIRNKFNKLIDPNCDISYFLYVIQNIENPIIKIGRSENIEKRLKDIIKDYGPSTMIYSIEGPYNKIKPLEYYLHNYFNNYCLVQASGTGRTEWFCESILNDLESILTNFSNCIAKT